MGRSVVNMYVLMSFVFFFFFLQKYGNAADGFISFTFFRKLKIVFDCECNYNAFFYKLNYEIS